MLRVFVGFDERQRVSFTTLAPTPLQILGIGSFYMQSRASQQAQKAAAEQERQADHHEREREREHQQITAQIIRT